MSLSRTFRSPLVLALGVAFAACLATPAAAQTAPQKSSPKSSSGKKAIEIDVHGGFVGGSSITGGTGTLPGAGTSFTTIAGTTTRSIPSWYFGDGTKLFNDFNKNVGLPTNLITPLDPALNTSATSRKSGGTYGFGISIPLSDRLAVEGNLDFAESHLTISDPAVATIAKSVSSFKSTFTTGLTGATGLSVTSTAATLDSQGRQMFFTGGVRFNLLTTGRILPFVTVGAGVAHSTGADTVAIAGNYSFSISCPGGSCPTNESDKVAITYNGAHDSFAMEFGGGVKTNKAAKIGFRADVRVYVSESAYTTSLSASPSAVIPGTSTQSAIAFGVNPDLQFSNVPSIKASLSGSAITNLQTFSASGMHAQVSVTGGIVFHF